jgi:protein involved in polysaccharide export with SLBB domain
MPLSRRLVPLLLLLLAPLWAGCKTPRGAEAHPALSPADVPSLPPQSVDALGSGDLLEIRVFQEADLTGTWRVAGDGTIDFPLCGRVEMKGKSTSQASDALAACLARVVRQPQVTVLVREYNSKKIYVLGEVHTPGTFPFADNMNVVQAITLAGGFGKMAARNQVNVTRVIDGQEKRIRVPVEDIGQGRERNFQLQPGDIVFVPESFF